MARLIGMDRTAVRSGRQFINLLTGTVLASTATAVVLCVRDIVRGRDMLVAIGRGAGT